MIKPQQDRVPDHGPHDVALFCSNGWRYLEDCMNKQGCIGRARRSLLLGLAIAAIGFGYANTTHAGVIAKSDIHVHLWSDVVFRCTLSGSPEFKPCGSVSAVLVGEDVILSRRGDVTFGDYWTVEARAGGTSSSSYSYGFLDRTLHFELTNPYEFQASFSRGFDGIEFTFEFSDVSVTDPGDYGRITSDFLGYYTTSLVSGVWACTEIACDRPTRYGGGSGNWYLRGATLAPGETYAFSVRAIVTAEARAADVPEPGALSVLVLGLAGLGFVTRRRQPAA